MAYILALNPLIIGTAADKNGKLLNGAPKFLDAAGTTLNTAAIDDNKMMVMAVTAFVAAIMTIAMGIWGRFPMGIATGLGINSLLAYVVAPTMTWSQAMGLVVWEGVLILVFVLTGVREMIFRAVPNSLRSAISVGIGLFIAFVGFVDSGVIRRGSGTPVTLGVGGSLEGWPIFLCLFGFLLLVVLHQRHVKGSMLIAIIGTSLLGVVIEAIAHLGPQGEKNPTGWALNVPRLPGADDFRLPDLSLLGHVDLFGGFLVDGHFHVGVFLGTLLVVFSLMLADFFDTMGTVVAIGDHAGILDETGNPEHLKGILVVDALAAVAGGLGSASSATGYVESAAGVGEGYRLHRHRYRIPAGDVPVPDCVDHSLGGSRAGVGLRWIPHDGPGHPHRLERRRGRSSGLPGHGAHAVRLLDHDGHRRWPHHVLYHQDHRWQGTQDPSAVVGGCGPFRGLLRPVPAHETVWPDVRLVG